MFEQRCVAAGLEPLSETSACLFDASVGAAEEEVEDAVDDFWQRVGDNLVARRLRLVFVADVIPRELQAIIEFLNEGLSTSDVLAVEVKQYVGEGRQTLVPRVIGWTTAAEDAKKGSTRSASRPTPWDEASFFADIAERQGEAEAAVARALFDWGERTMSRTTWGKGVQTGSFAPVLDRDSINHSVLIVYSSGYLQVPLGYMETRPPFTDAALRADFVKRLAQAGFPLAKETGWPSIRLSALVDPAALQRFLAVLDWAIGVITPGYSPDE